MGERGTCEVENPMKGAKQASQRQLRVGEELRHALSRVLLQGDLHDPILEDINITVTEVRLSPDLKNATAFVIPLGGEGLGLIVEALNRARSFLRGQLSREVTLRHTPRLSFQADKTFDEASHINEVLQRPTVRRDIEASTPCGPMDSNAESVD